MMLKTYLSAVGASILTRVKPSSAPRMELIAGPDSPRSHTTVTADAQKVAEFCRAVGEPVRNTVPVTWLHAQGFGPSLTLMSAPEFPVAVVGMVHITNTVTQVRPVLVGEVVTVTVWIDAIRTHPNGTEIVVAAHFFVDGELRVDERSHYLAKGTRVPGAAEHEQPERTAFEPPQATMEWSLSPRTADVYARVSGDVNPIHLNGIAAKAFGFRGRIIHGMYTAARALSAVQVRADSFTWDVEFATPIVLPGRVAARVSSAGPVTSVDVWDPRRGKPHMLSRVRVLPAPETA